jgi:hypothetical protein
VKSSGNQESYIFQMGRTIQAHPVGGIMLLPLCALKQRPWCNMVQALETVDGVVYGTFCEAAEKLELIELFHCNEYLTGLDQ